MINNNGTVDFDHRSLGSCIATAFASIIFGSSGNGGGCNNVDEPDDEEEDD